MKPTALCRGCGTRLDPAATKNWNDEPVYDTHPGCERRPQLQLIKGASK